MANTEIRLIIFFAAKDGEALYSQQKQDQGKRFIDVFDQKNTSLACALISAEAVNGMRVV